MRGSPARSDPEKSRRPWTTARTTMLRQWGRRNCVATSVPRIAVSTRGCAEQSHKDNVRSTAVEEN